MWMNTKVSQALGIQYPIIQAGMGGGIAVPRLAAAVSRTGGLGTLGAGYLAPGEIREAIREIRRMTDKPFAVNLLIPECGQEEASPIAEIQQTMNGFRQDLGIGQTSTVPPAKYAESFDEQMEVLLAERVPVFSFTFGVPETQWIEALKEQGTVLIGTATTVSEAVHLEYAGIDMVVGQGSEAGGHRATFLGGHEHALVGTMALIPQLADIVKIPVIAAGGIMDGRGVAASLALGASGVQLGTAFAACAESGAHPKYKEALRNTTEESTVVTRAFTGKPARGIRNAFIVEMGKHEDKLPAYPIQHELTRDIRKAAANQGRIEYMSMWAGQASRLVSGGAAADTILRLVGHTGEILRRL
jgi:nitronate monooxygenase